MVGRVPVSCDVAQGPLCWLGVEFCCVDTTVFLIPPSIDHLGFPGGTRGKESPANARDIRDVGLIPGSRRSPREENGNTHQSYSFYFYFFGHTT